LKFTHTDQSNLRANPIPAYLRRMCHCTLDCGSVLRYRAPSAPWPARSP
jgi:hypothetical protein